MLVAKAFIGIDGANTVRYEEDQYVRLEPNGRRRRDQGPPTEAKNTEVDLGDLAVYTTKYGIGVTYEVISCYCPDRIFFDRILLHFLILFHDFEGQKMIQNAFGVSY